MMRINRLALFAILLSTFSTAIPARGQQVSVGAPVQGAGDNFFEGMNIGFGAAGRNWFFNNGGGGGIPPLGGANPNAGANFGFGLNFPGGNGFFNVGAAQGSSQGISSMSPSITMMDGGTGYFAAVTQQPFVVGFVPVVGGLGGGLSSGVIGGAAQFGIPTSPQSTQGQSLLEERLLRINETGGLKVGSTGGSSGNEAALAGRTVKSDDPAFAKLTAAGNSSAGQPALSIAEIRRRQLEADETSARESQALFERGREAQAAGKPQVARIYFQKALSRATGKLKDQAEEALRSLGDSPGKR